MDAAAAAEANAGYSQPPISNPAFAPGEATRKSAAAPQTFPFGVGAPAIRDPALEGSTSGQRPGTTSIKEETHALRGKALRTISKAEKQLASGDAKAALKLLSDALDGEAKPYALALMGQAHLVTSYNDRAQLPLALAELAEATSLLPSDAPARANFAVALLLDGQNEMARKSAEVALRIDPTQAKTRYVLGRALVNLGRTEEAIYHLRIAAQGLEVARAFLATLPKAAPRAVTAEAGSVHETH
ncbi:MAG: hypothetical protein ABI824_13005 [Acidobacteriota bacterium]